ncbi:hypothetical protein J8L13_18460 [Bacteroides fragilis]|uniref:hypothetical protein n=1 Tax=Bacteroides fragilis TaxID=817 RepID=UPI0020307E15|nr:hypothetical protein [Bacteroides fragilis]MCM0239365.1 hypothetical protein [Bacteroides fragilis]
MLKDFIHIFTLSCKQATYLIEKRIHVPLSATERMRLAIHFSVCKLCQAYNKKAIFIDGWLKQRYAKGSCNCRFEEKEIKQFKEDVKEKIKV